MKKRILLFSFALFIATLCAGLFAQKADTRLSTDSVFKNHFSQKTTQQSLPEINEVSDITDIQDLNDLEKMKFDFSTFVQTWLNVFFSDSSDKIQNIAVQNHSYTEVPKYILYHSLQIASC